MAISKDKKREILAKLKDVFAKANTVAFVHFSKLTVADTSAVRKSLRGEGVGYYVAKKTLIKRALLERGISGELPELAGEIAIAWGEGEDTTLPARLIHAAGKKYKAALSLVGGVFEGAYLDATKMIAIATIPPLPVLRGMFANVINSPRQRFAVALGEVSKLK